MVLFEYENLFVEMVKQYGFNLFLGAGFSVYAQNSKCVNLPLGDEINRLLISLFEINADKNYDLSQTCQKIRLTKGDLLERFLRDTYKVSSFDSFYTKMCYLPIKNIFTTNIDDLLEKIYATPNISVDLSDVYIYGDVSKSNIINLYKLHGSVTHPLERKLSFTHKDLHDLAIRDRSLFDVVSYKLSSAPCLFIGTRLQDSNTIQLLCKSEVRQGAQLPKWVLIYPSDCYEDIIEEIHDLGYNAIVGDTKELIDYLSKMGIVSLPINGNSYIYKEYRRSFPNNFICKELARQSVARPIADFFQGAEPTISDVVSQNVIRTSYFSQMQNMIARDRITLISGIPGCGKSTLLLQLAFAQEIIGRKFWFSGILPSEAERLCKLVSTDSNAIIFIDNLYSNLESFQIIKRQENIKIVAAERAINYEFVKKSLDIAATSILDISDLSQSDMQKICMSMNSPCVDVKSVFGRPENISLLEIVFQSYRSVSVRNRIEQYIRTLEQNTTHDNKINLLELYSLVNYTSYCGIPISMDMMLFYFSDVIDSYTDILNAIRKMNRILVEVSESVQTDLNDQDYITMRSRLFSEISISILPKDMLNRVLSTFLLKVSSHIIYRYDIFRKRAYDADITTRAFNLTEGKLFYENIKELDFNPYIRHQYALFLQRKDDINSAWVQIDRAYTDSKQRIFTIANTHAIILFEKNIVVKPANNEKEKELKEIMSRTFDTLARCIDKDARVNYHILVYARNSLKYFYKFGVDEYSPLYIIHAFQQIQYITGLGEYMSRSLLREMLDIKKELTTLINLHNLDHRSRVINGA